MRIELVVLAGALGLAAPGCSGKKDKEDGKEASSAPAGGAPAPSAAASSPVLPPPAPAGGAVDPCALFSAAEAEEILGAPVAEPTKEEPVRGVITACSYAEKDGSAVIQVTLRSARSATVEEAIAEMAQGSGAEVDKLEVGGTPATWLKGHDLLYAAKSGWIVVTSTSKKADRLALSRALMEKVLPRLPAAP